MKVTETKIQGLKIIHPRVFEDKRGYFFESYNKRDFFENGIDIDFVQDNQSLSNYGVIRGLHYQLAPYAQSKLVRVLAGRVLDVIVDLRQGSLTFGHTFTVELYEANKKQVLIPPGMAHGFAVLSERAVFSYKCDNYYMPDYERGINPNDAHLNIDWKIPSDKAVISEKDRNLPVFSNAEMNYYI